MTRKSARDASRVAALLKQIDGPLASASADSEYDQDAVYGALEKHAATRFPRVLIPPKRNAQLRRAGDAGEPSGGLNLNRGWGELRPEPSCAPHQEACENSAAMRLWTARVASADLTSARHRIR